VWKFSGKMLTIDTESTSITAPWTIGTYSQPPCCGFSFHLDIFATKYTAKVGVLDANTLLLRVSRPNGEEPKLIVLCRERILPEEKRSQ
jgi:hypothetical protein